MKTITDQFEKYIGVHEYNGIVREMLTWYYGYFKTAAWCAISMSYMANSLGLLDQFGGKNQNCYEMLMDIKNAVKKTGKGKLYMRDQIPNGKVIKRGTVIFILKSEPPMDAGSSKHVTTAYQNFTYAGKGYFPSLGGNQSDEIAVKQYSQRNIYAIFEPDYSGHPTLRRGDKNSEVSELQQDLNYFGYTDSDGNKLKIDGSFGPKTESAVKNLQKDQGLKVDGICGPITWGRILEMLKEVLRVRTTVRLNLRKWPEKADNKIRVLQEGKEYYCSRWTDDWAYLPDPGGWVMKKYLERV